MLQEGLTSAGIIAGGNRAISITDLDYQMVKATLQYLGTISCLDDAAHLLLELCIKDMGGLRPELIQEFSRLDGGFKSTEVNAGGTIGARTFKDHNIQKCVGRGEWAKANNLRTLGVF